MNNTVLHNTVFMTNTGTIIADLSGVVTLPRVSETLTIKGREYVVSSIHHDYDRGIDFIYCLENSYSTALPRLGAYLSEVISD